MHRRKKIIVLISLIAPVTLAVAGKLIVYDNIGKKTAKSPELPDAKEEYKKLMQKYTTGDTFFLSGEIDLSDGHTPSIVKEKSSFDYIRYGHSFYSRLAYQKTLFNGKYLVQEDSLHRILCISIMNDTSQNATPPPTPFFLSENVFSDTSQFRVNATVTGDDKHRSIRLQSDFNPEVQYFIFNYSALDYSLESAEVRFWKKGRPEPDRNDQADVWISNIHYRHTQPKDPDIDGRLNKMFEVRKGNITPTNAYKDYKVIIK